MIGPYETNTVTTGDARELSKSIPDCTFDMVLTDPPYLSKYLPLYEWLAQESARVLKPGGWLIAYGAGEHLPDHLARMGKHLDYFWVFTLMHNGGYPRMWHKKLMSAYKPVMVYTKGKPAINPWMSTSHSDEKDKKFHEWGQGIGFPIKMIDMLTPRDGLVWEPMCGGGMVPAACVILRRDFLAFEIDEFAADTARMRLRTMQRPLPMEIPAQEGLKI